MSEAFIAHASNALNNAWSQNNTLVVDCAPLTDALTSLSLTVASLNTEMGNLREHVDTLRTQHLQLQAENSALRSRISDLSGGVSGLMDASTGMVGRQEYAAEVTQLKTDIDNRFKEQLDLVLNRMGSVTRVADEDRQRVMALTDSVDTIRTAQLEGFTAVRQTVGAAENNARGMNAERMHAHTQLLQRHEALAAATAQQMSDMREDLLAVIEKHKAAGSDALGKSVADLLKHLDGQAQRVDALTRSVQQRAEQIPTKQEIDRLCGSMDAGRLSLEDCQTQLQETFAQCMALLETSAGGRQQQQQQQVQGAVAPGTTTTTAFDGTSSMRRSPHNTATFNSAAPLMMGNANFSFASSASQVFNNTASNNNNNNNVEGGGGNVSLNATSRGAANMQQQQQQQQQQHLGANNLGTPGTFTSAFHIFERRLDHVQGLTERVLHQELPFLAADAKARHDDHVALVQAHKRAEAMLVALCDVLEIGTVDSLAAALRLPGVEQAQGMFRQVLKKLIEPVLGDLVTPQFLSNRAAGLFAPRAPAAGATAAAKPDDASSAQKLLRNPTVAAANSRYEAAMRSVGGGGGGGGGAAVPPSSRPVADENSASSVSGAGAFVSNALAAKQLRLGMDIADVDVPASFASSPAIHGVGIMSIAPNSVADRSGLARGDVILRFGDTVVRSCEQFMGAVQLLDRRIKSQARARGLKRLEGSPGSSVDCAIMRNGKETQMTIELEWS